MSSPPDPVAEDLRLLNRLTGAGQAWVKLCRQVVAAPTSEDVANLNDDRSTWARALRAGRVLPESDDDLSLQAEVIDVRAAHAIRDLTLYLAERHDDSTVAVAALLDHASDAHLTSVGVSDLQSLLDHLPPQPSGQAALDAVIRHLAQTGRASATFMGLLACHLAEALPATRYTSTTPALFDTADPAARHPGVAGRVALALLEHGPPGLHPNPSTMAFFYSPSPAFIQSLTHAWDSSPLAASDACVLWTVTLTGHGPAGDPVDGPANTVVGGSLGGAFAVALHDLHTQRQRRLAPVHRLRGLRRLHLDLRRRVNNSRGAISATVIDANGNLGPVTSIDDKVAAARRAKLDLVITHPDSSHSSHDDPQVVIRTADTIGQAIDHLRTSRNPRYRRTVAALTAAVVLIVAVLGLSAGLFREAQQRRAEVLARASDHLRTEAERLRARAPRDSLLLGEAAIALNPTPAARASLTETLAHNHYAGQTSDPGGVQALAVDHQGELLASATESGELALRQLSPTSQTTLWSSTEVANPIRALTFLPGTTTLITGDTANQLTVWDIRDPRQPVRTAALNAPALSASEGAAVQRPAVQDIAVNSDRNLMAVASSDGTVTTWNLTGTTTPQFLSAITGFVEGAWSVAFDPHRPLLAAGAGDNTTTLLSISDPTKPQQLSQVKPSRRSSDREHEQLRSITFGTGGRTFVTASTDRTVTVWDARDPRQPRVRQRLQGSRGNPQGGHTDRVFHVALTRDGRSLISVSADRTAIIWDAAPDGSLHHRSTLSGHTGYLRALALTPNGKRLITGSIAPDGTITVWTIAAPDQPTLIRVPAESPTRPGALRAVAIEPHRRLLATGGQDGQVQLYSIDDTTKPRKIGALTGAKNDISALTFTPDGTQLIASSWDSTIRIWTLADPSSPTLTAVLEGHISGVTSLAMSSDGRTLASGSFDGTVKLWHTRLGGRPTSYATSPTEGRAVTAVAFVDHDRLIAAGGINTNITLWDATDQGEANLKAVSVLTGHSEAVLDIEADTSGALLASTSYDATTILWSTTQPARPSKIDTLADQTKPVHAATFDANATTLTTGGNDGNLSTYSLSDRNHPNLIATVATPDGSQVLGLARDADLLVATTSSGDALLSPTATLDKAVSDPKTEACRITVNGPDRGMWHTYLPNLSYRPAC